MAFETVQEFYEVFPCCMFVGLSFLKLLSRVLRQVMNKIAFAEILTNYTVSRVVILQGKYLLLMLLTLIRGFFLVKQEFTHQFATIRSIVHKGGSVDTFVQFQRDLMQLLSQFRLFIFQF